VGVGDRVAHRHETAEQIAELDAVFARVATFFLGFEVGFDFVAQRVAANEPHDVERPAVGRAAKAVHGHDAGMLQLRGDLAFDHELALSREVDGLVLLDELQGHVAAQFLVAGHVHFAQTTLGQKAEVIVLRDAEDHFVVRRHGRLFVGPGLHGRVATLHSRVAIALSAGLIHLVHHFVGLDAALERFDQFGIVGAVFFLADRLGRDGLPLQSQLVPPQEQVVQLLLACHG
jgi:hypothetical protein